MSMKINDMIPEFKGATEWLNCSSEAAEQEPTGSPTLVYFWAVSCGICKQNMPGLRDLIAKYGEKGMKSVAIHMPRYETDTDVENVKSTVSDLGITEPCAIDNKHLLKDAFQNEQGWVPVYYLFDAEGKLRTRAAGEYGISVLTKALEKMFPA
ncbi:MAG: redoxin domain-containing protein [Pyrinomonadaceae bacterium]